MLRQRLPAIPGVPGIENLSTGGAEIDAGWVAIVRRHRFAQDQQIGVLLRQPLFEQLPRLAAVAAAPDLEAAVQIASKLGSFNWHGEQRLLLRGRHRERKTETARQ